MTTAKISLHCILKVLKTFKIPSDCHIKTCLSAIKRSAILKIPSAVFKGTKK